MFASKIVPNGLSPAEEERALAIMCQLFLEEIAATANADQRRGLLVAIGRRVAGLVAMPEDADLEIIADRANDLWAGLNWGSVGFEIDDEGIDVLHRGLPLKQKNQLQDWEEILPPVLEGAYGQWFAQIGGENSNLHTRITRSAPGEIELRYGL